MFHRLGLTGLFCTLLLPMLGAAPSRPLARYEPPDGVTWHGVCLPGYWSPKEFEANLKTWRETVTDRPLMLHSWFAHCKEYGKWRTWHWMNETPDGGKCAGEAGWTKELFDVIESTPQIKALCWFQWSKEWNLERDPGQLAEYQKRIRAARYAAPFAGPAAEK